MRCPKYTRLSKVRFDYIEPHFLTCMLFMTAVAYLPFKAMIELETMRGENDQKVHALYGKMAEMMSLLRE